MADNIIELRHISKVYSDNGFKAVDDFNLEVKRGEFVTFLGPSGCGKTTTLRMIAGFEMPTSGEILLNGEDISQLPANKRPINTVFQRYALFPHMNIYENIAFGLKLKKLPKEEIRKNKLQENIELLGRKQNPYPYFKISDCVILTSDYEGYPVVFLESFILNKPIITTKVSDYEQVEGKYGYVTDKSIEDIYEKMKLFNEKGFDIKQEFDANQYNSEIIKKLERIF